MLLFGRIYSNLRVDEMFYRFSQISKIVIQGKANFQRIVAKSSNGALMRRYSIFGTTNCPRLLSSLSNQRNKVEAQMSFKTEASPSNMMNQLYGQQDAKKVFDRLEELDPILRKEIVEVAYEHYWARPGLSVRDKSLVTVASLISLGKEEQTRIHMNGFLNAGGTKEELINMLLYFMLNGKAQSSKNGFVAFLDVLQNRGEKPGTIQTLKEDFELQHSCHERNPEKKPTTKLTKRDLRIIDLAHSVAIGDQAITEKSVLNFLSQPDCNDEDLKNIMIHQIVYCGFPAAMNGFAAFRNVMNKMKEQDQRRTPTLSKL